MSEDSLGMIIISGCVGISLVILCVALLIEVIKGER